MKDTITIKVVKLPNSDAISVDRRTPLGNPFPMQNKSLEERARVCNEYEKYFNDKVKEEDSLFAQALYYLEIQAINDGYLKLGCHCAPLRCHANTIAQHICSNLQRLGYDALVE